MSIIVGHERGGQGIAAILDAYLASQQQQQPSADQQQQDVLAKIRGIANKPSGRGRKAKAPSTIQAEQDSVDDGEPADSSKPPGYNTGHAGSSNPGPKYPSGRQSSRGGGDVFRWLQLLLDQNQNSDRLNQQADLAQFRAQEESSRQDASQQHQDMLEQARHADTISEHFSRPVPQWIQKGLSDGSLAYSEFQKRDRQSKVDAINRANSDPAWSPAQRATLEADMRQEIYQIDSSPQPVPPDERPVSPQEQYERNIIYRPVKIDDNTTLNLPVIPQMRAGAMQYVLTPEGKAAQDVALANLKHKQKLEEQAHEASLKPANQLPQIKYDAQQQAAYVAEHRKRELDALGPRPKPSEFMKKIKDINDENFGKKQFDQEAFSHAMVDWQAKRQAIDDHYSPEDQFAQHTARTEQQLQNIGQMAGGMSMLPIPGGPTTESVTYADGSGGDMAGGDQAPPPDQGAMDDQQQPSPDMLHQDENIGRGQWDALEHGAITSLPDGRIVQKTGPDSYAPVQ